MTLGQLPMDGLKRLLVHVNRRCSLWTARLESSISSPTILAFALIGTSLLLWGSEVFVLHLTIDEEVFADDSMWRAWVAQGRWGMALLSSLLVPRSVAPVVSTALGVLGFLLGLGIFVRTLTSARALIFVGVLFGVVSPALPYLLTFSTISYGAGIGAACAAFAFRNLLDGTRSGLLRATLLFTFAIAIYQPLIFTVPVMLLLFCAAQLSGGFRLYELRRTIGSVVLATPASVLLYSFGRLLAFRVTGVSSSPYVAGQIKISGILQSPGRSLRIAAIQAGQVFLDSPSSFQGHAKYVGPVLAACLLAVVAAAGRASGVRGALLTTGALGGVLTLMVIIEALAGGRADLRTLVFLPFLFAGLTCVVGNLLAHYRWYVPYICFLLLLCAASLGLASDMNRLFMSTQLVHEQDAYMALRLDEQITQLEIAKRTTANTLVVIGRRVARPGPLTPKADTIGESFFGWFEGDARRTSAFIRVVTGRRLESAPDRRAAEAAMKLGPGKGVWPAPGSLTLQGDTAVLRLSEPTSEQKRLWCFAGVDEFCVGH